MGSDDPCPEKKQAAGDATSYSARFRLLPSWRLLVTLLCLLGGVASMLGRVVTSFAVLCMVRDTTTENGTSPADLNSVQGEFTWSKQYQGVVLSAYFYGYVAALVIGGWVADRYPSHKVAICSAFLQCVPMLLIPEATRLYPWAIIVLRVLQGIAASAFYPSFNVIVRNWSACGEFALLFSVAWSGGYLGSASAFLVSSRLCQIDWDGGWPMAFYFPALVMATWALLACLFLTESPEDHRFASAAEKKYLATQPHMQNSEQQKPKLKSIWTLLSNLQVWIIMLSYFATSWFFASLNITLPMFMKEGFDFDISQILYDKRFAKARRAQICKDVLNKGLGFSQDEIKDALPPPPYIWWRSYIPVLEGRFLFEIQVNVGTQKQNGFVSALPSLSMGVIVIVGGNSFHYLHVKKGVSTTNSRKILSVIGLLVPAACMIAVISLPASQRILGVILISLAQGLSSIVIGAGPVSGAADIAPQYIGFIWGLASSFGNTTGFLSPLIATAMTPNGTLQEWCHFFIISIVQLVLLCVLIVWKWKSEIQPFARSEHLAERQKSHRHADTVVALEEVS